MSGPVSFPLPHLPLGGTDPVDCVSKSSTAAEGETVPVSPQYLRLFGPTRPDMAIVTVPASYSSGDDGTCGPPRDFCDPIAPAGHLSPSCSAAVGHPSARSLASIAALRLHHIAKGHTPESDAQHGPVFFMAAARAWWERAKLARSAEARRKAMVAAAAIFVAMIDAHDFTQQQGATPDEKA